MKTTLKLPDELFRQSEAAAALRGESLQEFFMEAIQTYLERPPVHGFFEHGWRSVFGKAKPEQTAPVDASIEAEFEQVDRDQWR